MLAVPKIVMKPTSVASRFMARRAGTSAAREKAKVQGERLERRIENVNHVILGIPFD